MIRAFIVAAMLSGCAHRVPVAPPAKMQVKRPSMFCFEADITHKKGKRMAACADTLPLCQEALSSARKWGALGGVTRLFPCEFWVSR